MSAKQEKRLVSIRVIRGRKGRHSKYRLRVAGEQSRREFLRDASLSIAGVAAGATIPGMIASKARAADPDKKLGFALCGLGSLSTNPIAPALQKTRNCRLAGIVAGTPAKAEKGKAQYNIPERTAYGEKGWFGLDPAYSYGGIRGRRSDGREIAAEEIDQFAAEMDNFAERILTNRASKVSGEEGLRDIRILMAVYESTKTGQPVKLA